MKVETVAEQIFFITAFLTSTNALGTSTATGFVYRVESEKGGHNFLITNKHVIEGFDSLKIRFIEVDGSGNPNLGVPYERTIENLRTFPWVAHPDPAVDIVAISLSNEMKSASDVGKNPFFKSIDSRLSFEVGIKEELDALLDVTFVGYPVGLFDTHNLLPIARRGMTATPVSVDFNNEPAFLIDAAVYPGSSGSPVFLLNHGWIASRTGPLTAGSRIIFLGIVAKNINITKNSEIREFVTSHVSSYTEAISLGIVYKARCVDECANALLNKYGLTRKIINSEPEAN